MMDVTFVLEESGVTATVEVPCEADAAAAKEVACTALAVSPASVEMRIGTQVVEGTCRLQDTASGSGVQVVLARCFADIKCPAEYSAEAPPGMQERDTQYLSLSPCGTLFLFTQNGRYVAGLDTETFNTAFRFTLDNKVCGAPAITRCKTCCYLACKDSLHEVALPGGEVLRKVEGPSSAVFACGGVVVSQGKDGVSVYDEDLTLLRFLSHEPCAHLAVSDCGGWVVTSSHLKKKIRRSNSEDHARLWDLNTGEAVACVPASSSVALSRSASVIAVACSDKAQLYDWSGAALRRFEKALHFCHRVHQMQFTPSGKYLVVQVMDLTVGKFLLHQYDVATMSCVRVIPDCEGCTEFAISPCSRVVLFTNYGQHTIVTRHLYPY